MLGGYLTDITADCSSQTLAVSFSQVGTEGDLILNMPRVLFDSPDGDDSFFFLVDGKEIDSEEIDPDPDSRTFHVPLPPDAEMLEIIYPSAQMIPQPISCGVGGHDKSPYRSLLPPLKQFKSGIPSDEIQCNDDLVLLQKHDGTPACVKPDSVIDLIKRNWMTTEEIDGYAIDYDGDVKHLPFADICSDEMKIILLTHSNISLPDEIFVMEDVELPSGMNQEDFDSCAQATSFTKSRWNMVTMENPEPSPELEPENKELQEHYDIEIIGLKDKYEIGEKYSFYFIISGYGYSCANYDAKYPDENGNILTMGAEVLCAAEQHMTEFEINNLERKGTIGNIGIEKSGTYSVTVTFEKPNQYFPTSVTKTFEVVE